MFRVYIGGRRLRQEFLTEVDARTFAQELSRTNPYIIRVRYEVDETVALFDDGEPILTKIMEA